MQPFTQGGEGGPDHRGAVCSAHPLLPATSTCVRCGDFLCETCSAEGESICANCRGRVGGGSFPFERSNFQIDAAITYAWDRFKAQWLPLVGAGMAVVVIPYILQIVQSILTVAVAAAADPVATAWIFPTIVVVFSIPQILLQQMLFLAGFRVAIDVLEGRLPSFPAYFGAMKRCFAALGQLLLIYLVMALTTAPLVGLGFLVHQTFGEGATAAYAGLAVVGYFVPFVYVMLGLSYMSLELVYDRTAGPIEAMRRSWAITRGKRLDVFLLVLVQIGVAIAGLMMCCVGLLPAMGLFLLIQATGFLGLRRGLLAMPPA
jgi:hypothetical protein